MATPDPCVLTGAFFIPYFIALVFEGIPLFHIELAIGQHLHKGSIGVWTAISPYLGSVGRPPPSRLPRRTCSARGWHRSSPAV